METYLLFGDVHIEQDVELDPSYLLFKKVAQKLRPNKIICGGDLADFSYISRWTEGMPGMLEGKRLKTDFDAIREEIKFFKKCTKEFIYLEGNHEERIKKFLDKTPVLKGVLSLEALCEEEGVPYIETGYQPYKILDDLYVTHGISFNKYFASWTVEKMNENIVAFHTHRTQTYTTSFPTGKIVTGYGIGCLSDVNPPYVAGKRITGHTNSFGILYLHETGEWQLDIIPIKNNSCVIGKKIFNL